MLKSTKRGGKFDTLHEAEAERVFGVSDGEVSETCIGMRIRKENKLQRLSDLQNYVAFLSPILSRGIRMDRFPQNLYQEHGYMMEVLLFLTVQVRS